MPGPKPKYSIALTSEEEQELRRLAKAHKSSQGQVLQAEIALYWLPTISRSGATSR